MKSNNFFLQFPGETIGQAIEGMSGFPTLLEAVTCANEELPYGSEFCVLDADSGFGVVYVGAVAEELATNG